MPDDLDRIQDRQLEEQEARTKQARLPDVPVPTYRDCDDCGDEIAAGRLRAVPTATRCIGCQQLHERFRG